MGGEKPPQTAVFITDLNVWRAPVPTPLGRSGPNVKRECRPTEYFSAPNLTVVGGTFSVFAEFFVLNWSARARVRAYYFNLRLFNV